MKFEQDVIDYLNGTKFSNGLRIKVAEDGSHIHSRLEYLVELSRGKKIVHMGFADHIPLIRDKIKSRQWLHGLLMECTEKCVGIDIDAEAVAFVKNELNIKDVIQLNVVEDAVPAEIANGSWDLMIVGEVLEHVDNPVAFLTAIREKYKPYVKSMVVTVPNAFDLNNIPLIKKNIEWINTDHRFWFTPFTLAKVLTRAGFTVSEFQFCQTYMPEAFFQKRRLRKHPAMRETLVMTAFF